MARGVAGGPIVVRAGRPRLLLRSVGLFAVAVAVSRCLATWLGPAEETVLGLPLAALPILVGGVVLAVATAVMEWRDAIVLDDDGVSVAGRFGRVDVPWSEVEGVRVVRASHVGLALATPRPAPEPGSPEARIEHLRSQHRARDGADILIPGVNSRLPLEGLVELIKARIGRS